MSWALVIAGTGVAIGGAGLGYSIYKGESGDDEMQSFMGQDPRFHAAPEYEEAKGARGTWWDKLQEWGGQKGYGAISPDWSDIWGTASKRLKQYYWGGPSGDPGIAGKVKASAAERGVAESPALQTELTRMGMGEAGKMRELATTMGIKEAEFGETGRQNWMTQLMRLAGMKVPGMWQTAQGYMPTQGDDGSGLLGEAVGTVGSDWLKELMSSTTSGGGGGSTYDYTQMPDIYDYNKLSYGSAVKQGGLW